MKIGMTHITTIHKHILLAILGGRLGFTHKSMNIHQLGIGQYIHKVSSVWFSRMTKHRLNTLFGASNW